MKTACHYFKHFNIFYALVLLLLLGQMMPAAADNHTPSDYPALGEAEFPGLCKYRGHIGKYQCKKVKAKKHKLYFCKGKNSYFSKIDGKRACYSCPEGYTRFSPTRKMNHKKACTIRKLGKNDYARATKIGDVVKKCPKGQFKHKGFCKSCPAKTKRMHVAGLDNGYCKVEKKYRCNTGLRLHKSEPETGWDKAGNLLGLKHKKYCGMPFSLKQYGKDIVESDRNQEAIEALKDLGKALTRNKKTTKNKMKKFKKSVKKGDLQDAYEILLTFEEFKTLKGILESTEESATSVGSAALDFTFTAGYVGDGSVGLGYAYEWGTALDFSEGKIKKYKSHAMTKGFSLSGDGSLVIGIWKGSFNTSYSQGYIGAFEVGPFGIGLGVWSDYYTPKRSDGSNQPHFVGITYSQGFGLGLEVAEYNEVYTEVTSEVSMTGD